MERREQQSYALVLENFVIQAQAYKNSCFKLLCYISVCVGLVSFVFISSLKPENRP
jgi:hypothetical protein